MALRCDFHTHVEGDVEDRILYTPKQLIDGAAELGYDVLAFTCHNAVVYSEELAAYASGKGILLIPAVEKTVEGKHVLLYNVMYDDVSGVRTFDDIRALKKMKNVLVIAPHPYYPVGFCLGDWFERNNDVFDAVEYSHFHTYGLNRFNRKAEKIAHNYWKPLVGTSDCHIMAQFGTTYSLVDAEKSVYGVIRAVKEGRVQAVSPPLPLWRFVRISAWIVKSLVVMHVKRFVGRDSSHISNDSHVKL